eukprot:203269-Pelagomonas_calceolata.AAC.4
MAVHAYESSFAKATKVPVTKLFRSGEQVLHFRHADTSLAIPRMSAWLINFDNPGKDNPGKCVLCRGQCASHFCANSKLIWNAVGLSLKGCDWEGERKKRKEYAGHRPHALRKGPLTSKLARASPE